MSRWYESISSEEDFQNFLTQWLDIRLGRGEFEFGSSGPQMVHYLIYYGFARIYG